MEKELTLVIPCKNEGKNIERLLLEISLQEVGKALIIISDANSDDGTPQKAKKISSELGLNLIVIPGGLPSKGRNEGAFLSKTEYILFLDADVTFTPKFSLKKCLDVIKNGNFDMLSSTPVYRGEKNIRASILFWMNKIGAKILKKSRPFAIGAFTLVRRDIFLELGGYDETLKHTEDWIFSRKIDPSKFLLIPDLITQDDRRFRKFGYWKMIVLVFRNWIRRNDMNHFRKEEGYWGPY